MKLVSIMILIIGCVKSDNKDAAKHLHLNKTRFEKQIDMINSCLKEGGLSDDQLKTVNSKKILESRQIETPELVCANFTSATLEHPTVRRCRYLLHPIETIESCFKKAQNHNAEFRANVAKKCRELKQEIEDLSDEIINKRNLKSFPMYHWLTDRQCDDDNYDVVHQSAGSGRG